MMGRLNRTIQQAIIRACGKQSSSISSSTHQRRHHTSTTTTSPRPERHRRCRRVVITGMGAVSPLGNTMEDTWSNLIKGASGITTLEEALVQHQNVSPEQLEFELQIAKTLPCQVAAPVQRLLVSSVDTTKKNTARCVQMALLAAEEALQQANLIDRPHDDDDTMDTGRMGVSVGSGMSGVREITQSLNTIYSRSGGDGSGTPNIRKLSPHFIPKVLTNSAAGRISVQFPFLQGPNLAPSTACAAGSHAIGDAYRAIQYGTADVMVAGGTEASIEPLGMAGFCRLRALSTGYNDCPERSSRPFDQDRDGFVMGEGAAILVLEELEHALRRGLHPSKILAEVVGYGSSGDAFHITAPDPQGMGAERAMIMALDDADTIDIDECDDDDDNANNTSVPLHIGYINAHATSTPKGDEIEAMVIDRVLRGRNSNQGNNNNINATPTESTRRTFMSSTKGATGHLLGAAGALEAAITVQSLVTQILPPTRNLDNVIGATIGDTTETLSSLSSLFEHIANDPIHLNLSTTSVEVDAAMSNSFGFGGTNASLVFRRYIYKA